MKGADMPWSAILVLCVTIPMLVGLLVAGILRWTDPRRRELRAIARKNAKQRKWRRKLNARIYAEETDPAWTTGQFSVGRDVKDRHL